MKRSDEELTLIQIFKRNWLLILGIGLVGANLRVPLTSIGSLIPFIREDLNITHAMAGSITTLPLLAFAFLSPFAPKIARRFGMKMTIFLSLILIVIGITIRSPFGFLFVLVGTLFIGLGISIGNVLIPGMIKIHFPFHVGLMTGIYAIFMNVFAAIGSGFSVPLAAIEYVGWRGSVGIWGILAFITLLIWLPQLQQQQVYNYAVNRKKERTSLWHSVLAWNVTLFMGSQSFIYYTNITWLPDILQANGYNASTSGWFLFLLLFVFIPFTFIIPLIVEKLPNQVYLSITIASMFIVSYSIILFSVTTLTVLAIILIGMANGSSFGLSMMFFSLRTNDGDEAAELSGMAQSIGYLLAAIGPIIIGAIYDFTATWIVPILLLICMACLVMINGIIAGKNRTVS